MTLPVLMYHSVGGPLPARLSDLVVAAAELDEHLAALADDGWSLVGLTEALARPGDRVVALTFDDGYTDFLDTALPVLQRHGARSTLYVPTRDLGGCASWLPDGADLALLDAAGVAEVAAHGQEIGSHGARHVPMDVLPAAVAGAHLRESRRVLEDVVGRPVRSFCYPHGYHSRRLRERVRRAGYANACAIGHRASPAGEDPWAISRLMVRPGTGGRDLVDLVREGRVGGPVPALKRLATPAARAARHAGLASHAPYRPGDDGDFVDVTGQERSTAAAARVASLGVLVCTHAADRLDQLARAVTSLDAQTRVPDEVLVLVDGDDDLGALVRDALPARLPRTGVEVRVEALGRNRGVSVARTTGAARMGTDLLAFLDDDAEAEPGWLAALESPLADERVLGSSGRSEAVWTGTRPAWLADEFLWTVGCSYAGMPTEPARVRNVYGGCAAVRRRLFLDLGGYDPELGHGSRRTGGGEEADFCLRATAATGGEFAFEPAAVIRHAVPPDRLTWRYYLERCRSEGELKALLADRAEAGSLGPETAFARALPHAVVRALLIRGHRQQAIGMVLGAAAVVLGLVRGTVHARVGRR